MGEIHLTALMHKGTKIRRVVHIQEMHSRQGIRRALARALGLIVVAPYRIMRTWNRDTKMYWCSWLPHRE